MQLLFVAALHSAALLTKRLFERVDGVKENGCGGVPRLKEMPLERIVPAAETELFAQGRSNGAEPFAQAIAIGVQCVQRVFELLFCMRAFMSWRRVRLALNSCRSYF
jgi:hypothetical protein